jgi:hypothetical protein
MGAGSVVAGVIVFVLGAAGLISLAGYMVPPLNLASVAVLFTRDGAFVLYGAIAVIGIALIVTGGIEEKPPVVVVTSKETPAVVVSGLTSLELTILRSFSIRKSRKEIAKETGVSEKVISEKADKLRTEGFVTSGDALTEKGYEAIRQPAQEVVLTNPHSEVLVTNPNSEVVVQNPSS